MTILYRPKVLWITRSQPFGLKIARLCGSEGLPALAVPLLQVIPLAVSRPEDVPDAILFTSAQGVRNHPYDPRWRDVPVLTVGDATAAEALAKGYHNVRSAGGNVEDLKALTATEVAGPARIFLFTARDPAGDLEKFLKMNGYRADRFAVYETRSSTDIELRHAIDLFDRISGICVYSPKAAERLSELLRLDSWEGTVFCLSQVCADRIGAIEGVRVAVARHPNDRSLRHLVRCQWKLTHPAACVDDSRASGARAEFLRIANDNPKASAKALAGMFKGDGDDPPPTAA